jgi:hypothetical protein
MLYVKNINETYDELNIDSSIELLAKGLANDYVLYLTIEWYLKKRNIILNDKDRKIPQLESSKLFFYPFYYSTANGHSKDLFEILKPFNKFEFGIFSENLFNRAIAKNTTDGGKSYKSKFFQIENNEFSLMMPFLSICEGIKGIEVTKGFAFKDLFVAKDDNSGYSTIIEALESSQRALLIGTNNNFLDFGLMEFKQKSKPYPIGQLQSL